MNFDLLNSAMVIFLDFSDALELSKINSDFWEDIKISEFTKKNFNISEDILNLPLFSRIKKLYIHSKSVINDCSNFSDTIKDLKINGSNITQNAIYPLSKLEKIDIRHNTFISDISHMNQLKSLVMFFMQSMKFPKTYDKLHTLNVHGNLDILNYLPLMHDLKYLTADNKYNHNLIIIKLSPQCSLKKLHVLGNSNLNTTLIPLTQSSETLEDLSMYKVYSISDFNAFSNLRKLTIDYGSIDQYGISRLLNIESLSLTNCPNVTDVNHMTKLKYLKISNNSTVLDVSNLSLLEEIEVYNVLKIVGLNNSTKLRKIELISNQNPLIDEKDIKDLVNVTLFRVNFCDNLHSVNHMTKLVELYIGGINYASGGIKNLPHLRKLTLVNTRRINKFNHLTNLEKLYISSNTSDRPINIEGGLSNLVKMKRLDLINVIGVKNSINCMLNLESLIIIGITDVYQSGINHLTNLKNLDLQHNIYSRKTEKYAITDLNHLTQLKFIRIWFLDRDNMRINANSISKLDNYSDIELGDVDSLIRFGKTFTK